MQRVSILFAAAAILLLMLGLAAMRWTLHWGAEVTLPKMTYMLPPQTVCFGLALIFCCFAFFYSLWMIPWSSRAAAWHFGLSALLLGVWTLGLITFAWAAANNRLPRGALPLSTQVILASWIVAPFLFAGLQAGFFADAVRRCWLFVARG